MRATMTGVLSAYQPAWGEFVQEFAVWYCRVHRMPVARQGCLQRGVSYDDNLWCEDGGLTNNPVTVLGDVVLDGLLPAKGLLYTNVNMNGA